MCGVLCICESGSVGEEQEKERQGGENLEVYGHKQFTSMCSYEEG